MEQSFETNPLSELREDAYRLQIPIPKDMPADREKAHIRKCIRYLQQHYHEPEKIPVGACRLPPPAKNKCFETLSGLYRPQLMSTEQLVFMPYFVGDELKYLCLTSSEARWVLDSGQHPHTRAPLTEEQQEILTRSTKYPYIEVDEYPDALKEYFDSTSRNRITSDDSQLIFRQKIEELHEILQKDNPQNIDLVVSVEELFTTVDEYYLKQILYDYRLPYSDQYTNSTRFEILKYILNFLRLMDENDQVTYRLAPGENNDTIVQRHSLMLEIFRDIKNMSIDNLSIYELIEKYRENPGIYPPQITYIPRILGPHIRFTPSNEFRFEYTIDLLTQMLTDPQSNFNALHISGELTERSFDRLVDLISQGTESNSLRYLEIEKITPIRLMQILTAITNFDLSPLQQLEIRTISGALSWTALFKLLTNVYYRRGIFDDSTHRFQLLLEGVEFTPSEIQTFDLPFYSTEINLISLRGLTNFILPNDDVEESAWELMIPEISFDNNSDLRSIQVTDVRNFELSYTNSVPQLQSIHILNRKFNYIDQLNLADDKNISTTFNQLLLMGIDEINVMTIDWPFLQRLQTTSVLKILTELTIYIYHIYPSLQFYTAPFNFEQTDTITFKMMPSNNLSLPALECKELFIEPQVNHATDTGTEIYQYEVQFTESSYPSTIIIDSEDDIKRIKFNLTFMQTLAAPIKINYGSEYNIKIINQRANTIRREIQEGISSIYISPPT